MALELSLTCHHRWLWIFNLLLQKGVKVRCLTHRCLMDLLAEDFQMPRDYIIRRIQTITLDGRPVDDPATAVIQPDTTLSISGAMPGLAGATLRMGGHLAAMRSGISYCSTGTEPVRMQAGLITIKLFNLILKDQGPAFLSRGIGVSGAELVPLLDEGMAKPSDEFGPLADVDGILDWPAVRESYRELPLVFITINARKD